jgi:NADH:ubiquinone oxidoreductase subunit C
MTAFDRLPDAAAEIFGDQATGEESYDLLTVDVPAQAWIAALTTARDELGCTYFDWLSAVDEPGTGLSVCVHLVALGNGTVRRLLIRTTVPHEAAALPTATDVYAGAAWHERETHEMFGIDFTGHPHLEPLLLPEGFEGHPLRKDFVLAARVAKAWPGAKEPGESEHGGPKRRQMLPPGVPDPNEWGPLKGQLPPAPARPARAARAAAGDRPPRRTRSVAQGSASQQTEAAVGASTAPAGADAPTAAPADRPARRTRTPDAPWEKPRDGDPPSAATEAGSAGSAGPEETVERGKPPGTEAAPGTSGTEGAAGTPGAESAPETSGTEETPGAQGAPRTPGTPGTPGTAGTTGAEGAEGTEGGDVT